MKLTFKEFQKTRKLIHFNDDKEFFRLEFSYLDIDDDNVVVLIFADEAAWYHIVFAIDTTQATDTNRFKLYVSSKP